MKSKRRLMVLALSVLICLVVAMTLTACQQFCFNMSCCCNDFNRLSTILYRYVQGRGYFFSNGV